ncbi:prolyl oligopeptidase family serine peptidase [Nonomuraea angiospora]|uniref:prolyl oligopeptidase family serine peptidase n=1 Tax=Nonomuraea angiospora TaxID=46172 RepID=UPI0029BCE0F8|nr:prolyl oligopeptidase family serine peptidase [Nonomuraea angiospora]MDX3100612.1 prolyl oligopeptidase family serine peptidase [Nonomuraea angiospora]
MDLLIEQGAADPDRLGIGGYMAAWAVGQTDRFKVALVGAGTSDWGMLAVFEAAHGGGTGWEGAGPHPHDERTPISHATKIRLNGSLSLPANHLAATRQWHDL